MLLLSLVSLTTKSCRVSELIPAFFKSLLVVVLPSSRMMVVEVVVLETSRKAGIRSRMKMWSIRTMGELKSRRIRATTRIAIIGKKNIILSRGNLFPRFMKPVATR